MKVIPLSHGKETIVDDADYEELSKYKWWFSGIKGHGVGYAVRAILVDGKKKTILMHRQILNPKPWPIEQCDHIDGNGLNNCRSNLRLCSHIENHRNLHTHKSNKLGVKGVSLTTCKTRYFARITVNYRQIYLGCFESIEDAIQCRKQAEMELFGDFRRK